MIDPPRLGQLRHGAGAACAGGLLALAAALSGCVETSAETPPTEAHQQFARRPGANLASATIAFVSVDAPSSAISANFMQLLAKEAAAHDIVLVDPKKARYLVRGYLSASGATDGAAVEYVWDVFTRDRQRAQRVNDIIDTKGENPWRPEALASIAANSAEDLAAYLSNTPEAAAAAEPAAADAKAMSYAAN